MNDAAPDSLIAPPAAPRDRRIVVTATVSLALHALLFGALLLPRLHLPEPAEPPVVNVELVPAFSVEPEAPSSEEPPSAVSSELPPSLEPLSSAAVSSTEPPPSAVPSSADEPASASEPPPSVPPPTPAARPIVIPVGPSAPSSELASSEEASSEAAASASEEPSSAASEPPASLEASASDAASALTTTDATAGDDVAAPAAAAPAPPPSLKGALRAARRFYLDAVLDAPAMARARQALKQLPPEKRLVQTCNIEAVGQLGNAGRNFVPDAVVANAFVPPTAAGSSFSVKGGAFRSKGKWYALAYSCTLSRDMGAVTAFSYRIGADVTAALKAKMGE